MVTNKPPHLHYKLSGIRKHSDKRATEDQNIFCQFNVVSYALIRTRATAVRYAKILTLHSHKKFATKIHSANYTPKELRTVPSVPTAVRCLDIGLTLLSTLAR